MKAWLNKGRRRKRKRKGEDKGKHKVGNCLNGESSVTGIRVELMQLGLYDKLEN